MDCVEGVAVLGKKLQSVTLVELKGVARLRPYIYAGYGEARAAIAHTATARPAKEV
jgi:hypothetical protein